MELGRGGKKEIMKQRVAGCNLGVSGVSGQEENIDKIL